MLETAHTLDEILNEMKTGGFTILPEEDFECSKHGIYWVKPIESVLTNGKIIPPCPRCKQEAENELIRLWQIRDRLKKMNIGEKYQDATFENFNAYTPELKKYLETARRFAQHPTGKLVMLGKNGTGKTHLAVSALKAVGGVIHTVYEIGAFLRRSYKDDAEESEQEILDRLSRVNLLVLDEIGRSKGSDWEKHWLSYLLNDRHENNKPTILISNRHFKAACPKGKQGCPHCLNNFLDTDIMSRIMEDGIIMSFTGDDYRIKKGQQFRSDRARGTQPGGS